jgi:hypothetical protein
MGNAINEAKVCEFFNQFVYVSAASLHPPTSKSDSSAILMLAIPKLVELAGPDVVVTTADPGFVATDVVRDMTGLFSILVA